LTLVNKVILRMGLAFIQPAPVGPRPGLHLLRLPRSRPGSGPPRTSGSGVRSENAGMKGWSEGGDHARDAESRGCVGNSLTAFCSRGRDQRVRIGKENALGALDDMGRVIRVSDPALLFSPERRRTRVQGQLGGDVFRAPLVTSFRLPCRGRPSTLSSTKTSHSLPGP
jgi:hypothetical protein